MIVHQNLFFSLAIIIFLSIAEIAGARSKDWDYFVFTQSWPATTCLHWKSEGQGHRCSLPKDKTWTVHGLWPTRNGSMGPTFCNSSMPFDEEALAPILNDLQKYWTNVEVPTEPYSFWKHEWEKHGTCAASLPALDKEVKYFSQGLAWLKKYNMYQALEMEGFSEGRPYTPKTIRDAVKRHYGKNPTMHCYKDRRSGKVYLAEIRICFSKDLKLIDCPKPTFSACPCTPVEYPNQGDVIRRLEGKGKWLLDFLRIIRWIQWITY